MNQKQIANEQISRTSGEPKQTALEERQMLKDFGARSDCERSRRGESEIGSESKRPRVRARGQTIHQAV